MEHRPFHSFGFRPFKHLPVVRFCIVPRVVPIHEGLLLRPSRKHLPKQKHELAILAEHFQARRWRAKVRSGTCPLQATRDVSRKRRQHVRISLLQTGIGGFEEQFGTNSECRPSPRTLGGLNPDFAKGIGGLYGVQYSCRLFIDPDGHVLRAVHVDATRLSLRSCSQAQERGAPLIPLPPQSALTRRPAGLGPMFAHARGEEHCGARSLEEQTMTLQVGCILRRHRAQMYAASHTAFHHVLCRHTTIIGHLAASDLTKHTEQRMNMKSLRKQQMTQSR